jgi:hypothetical protein
MRFDLAVTSVLLDAGAGPDWHYRHAPSGTILSRSEGLAIASFEAFRGGAFSSDPRRPLMADADGLKALSEETLGGAFQVGPSNPLPGLANRVALLRRLGHSLAERATRRARRRCSTIWCSRALRQAPACSTCSATCSA